MDITTSIEQGRVPVTVLHISGNIDANTFQEFEQKAREAIRAGTRYMLLDLANVNFMSSAGLHAMNEIFKELRTKSPDVDEGAMHKGISAGTYRSPHLKILNPSEEVRKVIQMAGFDMYLQVFTDLKKAVTSF